MECFEHCSIIQSSLLQSLLCPLLIKSYDPPCEYVRIPYLSESKGRESIDIIKRTNTTRIHHRHFFDDPIRREKARRDGSAIPSVGLLSIANCPLRHNEQSIPRCRPFPRSCVPSHSTRLPPFFVDGDTDVPW